MQVQIVGMAWYRTETFAQLRAMFEDGHKLHRTYKEWFAAAEGGRKKFESQGVRVVCVDIDPNQFPEWCKANGMKLNAEGRNKYASFIAYKVATGGQDGGGVH
jgi:hypothetical protein